MSRSIKVAPEHIDKVQLTLRQSVYPSQSALAGDVGLTRPTVSNFFNGKPIDYLNFLEICQKIKIDWREVAAKGHTRDTEENSSLEIDEEIQSLTKSITQASLSESLESSGIGDILVVDDRPDNIRLLSTMLSERGYKVRKAVSGEMALTAIDTAAPDLILLDITMPQMDGFDVCQRLKAEEKTRYIPVIFISALDEVVDKVKAFSCGGVDYITKPFQVEEVMARVESQLTIRRLQRQMQRQNRLLQEEIQYRLEVDRVIQEQNISLQKEVKNRLRIEKLLQDQNELMQEEIQNRQRIERTLQTQNIELQREISDRIEAEESLKQANQQLQSLSLLAAIDGLTQIANRRRFDEYLSDEWERLTEAQQPLSLILCDVDRFKPYNDVEGHQKGDECLQSIAKTLNDYISKTQGLAARYGGDEFAIILPNTDAATARQIAEQIKSDIQNLSISHPNSSVCEHVTLSMGIASMIPTRELQPDSLISITDCALDEAKDRGGNITVLKEIELSQE